MEAQAFSGNLTAQFQGFEDHANDELFLTFKLLVCSYDGTTTARRLLAITRATSLEPMAPTIINRTFPSSALTGYTCIRGDRLVIEVGLGGNVTTATGGVQGHNGSLRFGCSASSGDLPVDQTQTGTTYRPWMEISTDILLYAPGVSSWPPS